MAKKSPDLSFKDIKTMMENISKKTAILIDDNLKEKQYIDTGVYMLNALLTKSILNGGVPDNRFTVFAGPESVGKSYICYNIARNAQKIGYNVIYIDTEQSIELSDLVDFGIDIDNKFMLIRSNKVEDIKIMLTQLLDELKEKKLAGVDIGKTIIFLDSIGQLASRKEVEDAKEGKNKVDMSRAKAIKSLFRIISSDLGFLNIPLVATNHVYMCFTKETQVLMSDDTYKYINLINIGEYVKTLDGDKPVEDIVEFNNSTIMEIILDDGEIMKCTKNHKFLINEDWNEDENSSCWIAAEDLKENQIILAISE